MRGNCPACGKPLVGVFGREASPIVLVGDAPGWREQQNGVPWSGEAGDVLRNELRRAGITYAACRSTNFWKHAPTTKANAEIYERCYEYNYLQLLDTLQTARAVLLMGADLVSTMTGHPVSKINGVPVTSTLLPSTIEVLVATFNPAIALNVNGVIGDFRFAIQQFAAHTKSIYKELLNGR